MTLARHAHTTLTLGCVGSLDVLVNNAGYTWDGIAHRMTDKQWEVRDCRRPGIGRASEREMD